MLDNQKLIVVFQACDDYLPLAGKSDDCKFKSLDQRKLKKTQIYGSHNELLDANNISEESSLGTLKSMRVVSQLE